MIKASSAREIAEQIKRDQQNQGNEWVKNTVSEICKKIEDLKILEYAASDINEESEIKFSIQKIGGDYYEIYCNYFKFQHLCSIGYKNMIDYHDQLMAALSIAFTENEYEIDLEKENKVLKIKW